MTTEIMAVNSNAGDYSLVDRGTNDAMLVAMWIAKKNSPATKKQYRRCYATFTAAVGISLQEVNYSMLAAWSVGLVGSENTRKVTISAIKALFTFAHKIGYIRVDPAVMIEAPKAKDELAARILTEEEVLSMIYKTDKQRNNVLLRVLYTSAGRISEVCGLTWGDIQPNGNSGQVTLFGKGGKTRAVKLSKATWQALQALRPVLCDSSDPVFVSQKGGRLDETQVHRIVKGAAVRAGISGNVSAHWLRHSHASHALDRGANITLVRDTLGHSSLAVTSRYTHAKPNESSALHLAI